MKEIEQIMSLVDTYGSECCSGNEYDNSYATKQARDAVLKALKVYAPPRRSKKAQPLYAHPPQRKPLTDEEIVRLMVGEDRVQLLFAKPGDPYFSEFSEGAIRELVESGRAIERAHGIGGGE